MSTAPDTPDRPGPTLEDVVLDYLREVDAGRTPDPADYVARHPHLAAELAAFLADQRELSALVAPLRRPCFVGRRFGDYEVLGEIARGGMGVVYRARQASLGRVVALKMIRDGALAGPDERRRFRTEAENAARLDHPNIVPIYEVGEIDGQPYFTMKYIEGRSLAQSPPIAMGGVPALMATVARAVHHAHERGILHRDLKPANVLLDADGRPHVTDFGLAKRLTGDGALTRTGLLVGTPNYMAPEQASSGNAVTIAADVYGLGAVLYHLLTSRPPFQGDGPAETLLALRDSDPPRPRSLDPTSPPDLETICLKCLQKRPGARYGGAAEVADELERVLRGEPIRARPVGRAERLRLWCRRNPALAGLLGTAAVAALVVVGLSAAAYRARGEALRAAGDKVRAEQAAREEAENTARAEAGARRQAARAQSQLALDKGLRYCETGDVGPGLLWLTRALEGAVEAEDRDLERVVRVNVADWEGQMMPLLRRAAYQQRLNVTRFGPGGKEVLACSVHVGGPCGVVRWEAEGSRPPDAAYFTNPRAVMALALAANGSAAVLVDDAQVVRVWDTATTAAVGAPLAQKGITSAAFSAAGDRVLTGGSDGTARLWDAAGAPAGPALSHGAEVVAVAASPDGQTLLTGGADKTARLWSAATGRPIGAPLPHEGRVRGVAFSDDGTKVVTASDDGTARLWDARDGRPLGEPFRHSAGVAAAALSPDGTLLATESGDAVQFWETAGRTPVAPPLRGARLATVPFSPDGGRLLTVGRHHLGYYAWAQ
ncbi:MAG TPA: serine/threonine-protein kinase, partial [Gemmataceae bacterium]|nr:serine/threonine-protein kinase [Gemmataceae bacterium]